MAQALVAQTQAAGGNLASPMSGSESPSILGGDKITRTQAKKIFKDEVDLLVQGVKSIQVFADALAQMKKGVPMQVAFTDAQGQQRQYQIGRNEYRELVGQITKRMQKLPSLAFTLNKTRRRTGPNSGFLAPQQFNQDIVNFFSQATLGPQVTGELVLKTDKAMNKRSVPESTSLQEQPGTRLNDRLFFTQQQINGQRNPLYGIIAPGTLTPLFALHANYAENPDGSGRRGLQAIARDEISGQPILNPQTGQPEIDATRLTASNEMRRLLRNVMVQTIQNDAAVISQEHPELAQEAQQKAQQLIAAIENPNAFVDSRVGRGTTAETEMFNPNYFLYAHFSKLISNGKVAADQGGLTPEGLAALRPRIAEVYGPLLRQSLQAWQARVDQATTPEARELAQMKVQLLEQAIKQVPEQGVLTYQQDDVAKARAFKNQVQGAANRRRNAERKRAQAAQQAGGGLPTVPGLPGGAEVGGSPSGSSSGSRV